MAEQKPTLDYGVDEQFRRKRRAIRSAIFVAIVAVLLAGMSATFYANVSTTTTGPMTTTQTTGGVTSYFYHVTVTRRQPRRWYQLAVFIVMAIVLAAIYANYRMGNRKR